MNKSTFHRYVALSEKAQTFGQNFKDPVDVRGAVEQLLNGQDTDLKRIDLGALLRIAAATERIRDLLEVGLEPLFAAADQQRQDYATRTHEAWALWLRDQEAIHGPCPSGVAQRLRRQFYAGYQRDRPWWVGSDGWLHLHRAWAEESLCFYPYPPCGVRTKTRKAYLAWRKRRIRR